MADYVTRAKELEKQGRLKEALTYYETAVEEKSGSFDIRCDQGTVLNRLKQYDEADYCFNYVLTTMDENHFDSLFGKGISSLGLNKWDDALDNFTKCKNLDDRNANVWYYLSVLYKEKGFKEAYTHSFKKFKELDNENFSEKRAFYEFGINFKQKEIELINEFGEDFEKTDRYMDINKCIGFFKEVGVQDDEISSYINSVPIEELKDIINKYSSDYNKKLEMKIIHNELIKMGFEKDEIDIFIKSQDIEDLKSLIMSNSEVDPFNEIDMLSVSNLEDMYRSMPIYHAYDYKIPNLDINIENKETNKILKKISFKFFNDNKEKEIINYHFVQLSEKIFSDDDNLEVKNILDQIESFNINQFEDLKIKLDYYKVLINYYCFHNIQYEEIYDSLESISQSVKDMASNPIYIYIKSCILYDSHRYEEVKDNLIGLPENTQLNQDFVYKLLSSTYYKLGDYKKSYKEYQKISPNNINHNTLNDLSILCENQIKEKIN